MKIGLQMIGEVAVVILDGRLVAGEAPSFEGADTELFDFLARLVQSNCRQIVLDMTGVPYMDSSGLGTLVKFYVRCGKGSPPVRFALACPQRKVAEHLELTKLDETLEIYHSVDSALAGIRKKAEHSSFSGSGGDTDPDGHHHFDG